MKVTSLPLLFMFFLFSNVSGQVASCDCWIDRDTSWSVAAFDGTGGSGGPGLPPDYRNDDWSTLPIPLPFNFCFYGDTIQDVIINNNGNVSIGTNYSTFTASTFPDSNYTMIAPFWGDVDTRGPLSGIVYYKVFSTYIIVQWDSVGYYSQHDDKGNTFQLIISDGGASPLPEQKNIGFCYKTMQWTTGDASQGINGFGGVPATVGVNYGDGINYLQIGRYNDSTYIYDGPYGADDGIQSLSNQSFAFNVCVNDFNVPPILSGQYVCDTIQLCIGDTFLYSANFLAPELGQITSVSFNDHGMGGVTLNSVPGNQASLSLSIVAANAGLFVVDVIGSDDGLPAANTTYPLLVNIQNCITGLSDLDRDNNFIAPNPFSNELKYSFGERQNIRITDISGKIILNSVDLESGSINTSEWKNGIYFMTLTSASKTRVIKLVKN